MGKCEDVSSTKRSHLNIGFVSTRIAGTDGVSLVSGALLVADKSVRLIDMMHNVMAFFARESCGHCFPCRHGTLRSAEILERMAEGREEENDRGFLAATEKNLAVASFCGLGQAAAIPLRTGLAMLDAN